MSVEVASAFVSLIPSARGFGAKAEKEIAAELGQVADRQGAKFGKSFADKAAKNLDNFGKKALTRLTLPIGAAFAFATKAASDLSESVNKTDVVFGDAAESIHKFASTSAKDLGISKRAAEEAAGTFGNLFVALDIGQPKAAEMSTSIVKLASDLASFNNVNPEDALEALRAGLVGETEPLRRFGVNLNDAALREEALRLGLVKTTKDVLPPAAKAQAAYSLIMEQTAVAQGDFARTSDGLANQQRILKAKLEDTAASIGAKLLPPALKLVNVASDLVDGFTNLPEPLQNAALGFAAVLAASGPVALVIGKTITAAKALGTAYEFMTLRAGAFALASTGVGLALVGIGAGVLWIQSVREQMREMGQAVDNDMGRAVNQLALFERGEKEVAVNAYIAAAGVSSMSEAVKRGDFGKELLEQGQAARDELDRLANSSGVARERIVQLADSLGINLAKATKEQREELAGAIAEVGRAVTPTERLEAAQEALGNTASTNAEKFDAFKEALDAALGVQLTADQATLRYAERVDALAQSIVDNGTKTGVATEKQRLLTGSLIDVVAAASDEVEALVRSGDISADAAVQKQALIDRLNALRERFPALSGKIDEYIAHIKAIPDNKTTTVTVTGAEWATAKLEALRAAGKKIPSNIHLALIGEQVEGRAVGGPVNPRSMYEVAEGGVPELLRNSNGQTFLIPGSRGTVIPAASMPAGGTPSGGRDERPIYLMADGEVIAQLVSRWQADYAGARA